MTRWWLRINRAAVEKGRSAKQKKRNRTQDKMPKTGEKKARARATAIPMNEKEKEEGKGRGRNKDGSSVGLEAGSRGFGAGGRTVERETGWMRCGDGGSERRFGKVNRIAKKCWPWLTTLALLEGVVAKNR